MLEKQGMKFHSFSLPSIPPMYLRDSGFPRCLRERLMSLAVDVGAPCKKNSPSNQKLSSRLRYKLRNQTVLKFPYVQVQAAVFSL